jgi:tRNA (guanine37-N1)-methyltransferase
MPRVMFLCGRYEGYDERIREGLASSAGGYEEISLGDFVLAGGELPAMVVLEAAVRLIPGVLGCAESAQLESFETEWLDYPQYTRPREFRGMVVPDVLLSGDHAKVARWRQEQAELLTAQKRAAEQRGAEPRCGSDPDVDPSPTRLPQNTTEPLSKRGHTSRNTDRTEP